MKRSMLIICILAGLPALAQVERKSAVSVGYGILTTTDLANVFSQLSNVAKGGRYSNGRSSGAIIVNYRTGKSDKFKYGGSLVYQYSKWDVKDARGKDLGTTNNNFLTAALRADYYWQTGQLRLYSGASLGATFFRQRYDKESANGASFAYHLNALGLETGNKVAFYLEGGFGHSGILNGGLRFRF